MKGRIKEQVMGEMETVRSIVNEGLSARAKEGIKVRQPLKSASVHYFTHITKEYSDIIADELNVKDVITINDLNVVAGDGTALAPWLKLDFDVTPELHREGMMREVIRLVQAARKDAGLNVDDRILLSLSTDNESLRQAIDEHQDTIFTETLATGEITGDRLYDTVKSVEKIPLAIAIQKA